MSAHPWVLVAPWYRWESPGVPRSGRGTAPVLQKFASDTYVLDFLADPQRSLQFEPGVDQVQEVRYTPAPALVSGKLKGLVPGLFPNGADGKPGPSIASLRPTEMRKVYLDTHSRHYLVVCELHCDVPGFPSPDARGVCQSGLVVRRRWLSYPESAKPEAKALVRDLVAVDSAIAEQKGRGCNCIRPTLKARLRTLFRTATPGLAALESRRAELQSRLADWRGRAGAEWVREGWVPGEHERIGSWQVVEDEPQDLMEQVIPMWPLFADPAKPDHDATGRTIFYGVLPTASFDTDPSGKARFDDHTTYEVRCFVRRHDPLCPRGEAPDCHGEVIWSRSTDPYRIAPQFDLEGTSNRPITIQMPNLAELAAQAAQTPVGKFCPVKVIQPQALAPKVSGGVCSKGSMGGPSICFISIPLITIVALFVFNIFLPIVVLVFGLWFLLAFKFCIPPQIAFELGLELKLDAAPPEIDADFSINVDIEGSFQVVTAESLNADLKTNLGAGYVSAYGFEAGDASAGLGGFSNAPLQGLAEVGIEVGKLPKDVAEDPPVRPDLTAGLHFEARVESQGAAS